METELKTSRSSEATCSRFTDCRVHLIGIGGSGMRALAQMLIGSGATVSGSDTKGGPSLSALTGRGAAVHVGQRPENIPADCDLVVYSAAIRDDNEELLAARRRGVEVVKYSQMLGRLMAPRTGLALAGTHGKSTTTAMVAHALKRAGADPSFIVGANVAQLGGPSGVGSGEHFVAEACEFDRSFLNLSPRYAGILNVEEDHLDCYENIDAIVEAFAEFAALIPPDGVLVVNGQDDKAMLAVENAICTVETFGFGPHCNWRGAREVCNSGAYEMDILFDGECLCRAALSVPGRHNAYNALAAAALLHHAGLTGQEIADGLASFAGADRRSTLKGRFRGVTVVDDFAHHPTEITATLQAIKQCYRPQRVLCVFQPHQHSRTRFLLKDFARSFAEADEIIVPDIVFVRDSDRETGYITAQDLVSQIGLNGKAAKYRKTLGEIVEHLKQSIRPGDLVVTMGAGNIWEVADEIVRWLRKDS